MSTPQQREEEIFAAALKHAADKRDAYLESACAGDDALLQRIKALLAMHELAGSIPEPPDRGDGDTVRIGKPDDLVGQRIGRYKLLEQIGEGGCGVVYVAEQTDPVRRRVALKLVKLGMDTRQVVARFEAERQALALMDHPNIAKVFDAGATDTGRPYFVLELVRGKKITEHCDQYKLSIEERLNLFIQICHAVQHAHQKGIIHRDLKPSNVLVTMHDGVPVPKVIDFGIAKAINNQPLTDKTVYTAFEQFMGTPAYMSPEQAEMSGLDVDTRSDIYSLGVFLYELLTGVTPFDAKALLSLGIDAIRHTIREQEPPRPSTKLHTLQGADQTTAARNHGVELPRLVHLIQGDLDWIVMKCLEKDRQRRYETANGLAEDLKRHLTNEPVVARPPSKLYEFQKTVRRHKVGFAATTAIIIVLAVGVTLTTWQAVRATGAEKAAQAETQRADAERQRAVAAEKDARAAAERAATAEQSAKAEAERASNAEALAVQEKEATRQALAKSQLDLAEKEFERGKFVEAQKILNETPESFRDAHWRFLQAHARDFSMQLVIDGRGSAHRLEFLPQGDRFAVRCFRGSIAFITLTGQKVGQWIEVNEGALGNHSDAFGIDGAGARIAFQASAREVRLQEVATGRLVRSWKCEIGTTAHVLLSPDGRTVLVTADQNLIAYSTDTDAPLWTQPCAGVVPAFSPDGRTVANLASAAGLDLKIQLLDTGTGAVRRTIEVTADNPAKTTLQFNHTGDRLALLGGDEVIFWNPQTGAKIRALHFPGETVSRMSPDGEAVATFSGNRIRLWDTRSGRLLRSLNGARSDVLNLAFSPDGAVLLSSHKMSGGRVYVWPTRLGEEIASAPQLIARTSASRIVFDRDSSAFYIGAKDGVEAWDIKTGLQRWNYPEITRRISDLAVHPADGSLIVSELKKPRLIHLSSAGEALEAIGNSRSSGVQFNRSGQLLLAVRAGDATALRGAFSVIEYPSGNELQLVRTDIRGTPCAAFCLDDTAVATAAEAGGITVWDWKAGTVTRQIVKAQTGRVTCLVSSPNGHQLASGGPDRWIRVWDPATGQLETAFRAHWEGVRCAKFSPNGRDILSGSDLGAVRIHDAVTGEERLALYGLTTPVVDVDFSPDGKLIAAITDDGFTKVWDRQRSSTAALLPVGKISKEPVVVNKPSALNKVSVVNRPVVNRPVVKTSDGWEDHLASLTPAEVDPNGRGWRLQDGELFSEEIGWAALPLSGDFSGTSYQVRAKLRQVTGMGGFHVVLPVADRMTGFELDGFAGNYTGLNSVDGKRGEDLPGVVEGKQVQDSEPHDLEVTVRLDGANAIITTTLDGKPLYNWTGPTAALSQSRGWAAVSNPGNLALGTFASGWAVSEVKVRRLRDSLQAESKLR